MLLGDVNVALISALGLVLVVFSQASKDIPAPITGSDAPQWGTSSLTFAPNVGQGPRGVDFIARGPGYQVLLDIEGAELALSSGRAPESLGIRLVGSKREVRPDPQARRATVVNYIRGQNPARWRTGVPTFGRIHYAGVYDGIDITYHGDEDRLEYDLTVAPKSDPSQIEFRIEGANRLSLSPAGDLEMHLPSGRMLEQRRPIVFQEGANGDENVTASFALRSGNRVGIALGQYDTRRPLVIDPVVVYSSYLGGSATDRAADVAVDPLGNPYVAGSTISADFPGNLPDDRSSDFDAYITKLTSDGTDAVYTTFFSGADRDLGNAVAVDAAGNAFIAGQTRSTNFPTVNAFQATRSAASIEDAFLAKLDPQGMPIYSTFLGGPGYMDGNAFVNSETSASDIALEGGAAWVTGTTRTHGFPTDSAFQPDYGGGMSDAFIAEFAADGQSLLFASYLGGTGNDTAAGLAHLSGGDAFVTGLTWSLDFPTTPGAVKESQVAGARDGFVTKIHPADHSVVYSTLLGGSGNDEGRGIAVDADGEAFVTGVTTSQDFQITEGAFDPDPSPGYVTRLNSDGSLAYSTYLQVLSGNAITLDSDGSAYLTGRASASIPEVDRFQSSPGGGEDAYLTVLAPDGGSLVSSSALGGGWDDEGTGIARDSEGNVLIVGNAASPNFPTTEGAYDTSGGGDCGPPSYQECPDGFIVKVNPSLHTTFPCDLSGTSLEIHLEPGSTTIEGGVPWNVEGPGIVDQTCGGADSFKIDDAHIGGTAGEETLVLGGGLTPGKTVEGTGHSEVETFVDLAGGEDFLTVLSEGFGVEAGAAGINITGDDDADVFVTNVEHIALQGSAGYDHLSGAGAFADDDPAPIPLLLDGGADGDDLHGGASSDQVLAGSGDDRIFVRDGEVDQVDCGDGLDGVEPDRADNLAGNCEVASPWVTKVNTGVVGPDGVQVQVDWTHGSAESVDSYALEYAADGVPSWYRVQYHPPPVYLSLPPGHEYVFSVSAQFGIKTTPPFESVPFILQAEQERDPSIRYRGAWELKAMSSAYRGRVKSTREKDAFARLSFTGSAVAWVAPRSPKRGKARVLIDGVRVGTVDLYSSRLRPRRVVFQRSWSSSERHTLTVRALGTRNRPRVDVDAFVTVR